MKFLKTVGLTLARLFSKEEIVEKVARVATDPRISEPVFLMLRSIKKNPRQWRVSLVPGVDWNDAVSARHPMHFSGVMTVRVTDRITKECYEGSVYMETSLASDIVYANALKRVIDRPDRLQWLTMVNAPYWMTKEEARELFYALSKLMQERIARVSAYERRGAERRLAASKLAAEVWKNTERQRLIAVYEKGAEA